MFLGFAFNQCFNFDGEKTNNANVHKACFSPQSQLRAVICFGKWNLTRPNGFDLQHLLRK